MSDTPIKEAEATDWPSMTDLERGEAIRTGYLAGLSSSQIGRRLGVSRNVILGWAWRRHLSPRNAHVWQTNWWRDRSKEYQHRVWKKKTMAERRARLGNRATDPATREAVDIINSLPFFDTHIAAELGYDPQIIIEWRGGRAKISPFMQQCVADLPARMLPKEPKK